MYFGPVKKTNVKAQNTFITHFITVLIHYFQRYFNSLLVCVIFTQTSF